MMRRSASKPMSGQPMMGQTPIGKPAMKQAMPHAPRSKMQRAYTFALGALALIAGGYLTVLMVKPDILSPVIATSSTTDSPETVFDSEAEIAALRTSVGQLQTDVARTRSDISVLANNDRAFESTVGAIEKKIDGLSEALREQAVAAMQSDAGERSAVKAAQNEETAISEAAAAKVINKQPKQAIEPAAERAAPKLRREQETAAAPAAREPARQQQRPLETGSLGSANSTGDAVQAPPKPSKPFGLMITSAPSVDALRLYWSLVSDQHGGDLSGLNPRYVAGKGEGDAPSYKLVAGPVGSKADARRKCKQLAEKGVSCSVTEFGGNAL